MKEPYLSIWLFRDAPIHPAILSTILKYLVTFWTNEWINSIISLEILQPKKKKLTTTPLGRINYRSHKTICFCWIAVSSWPSWWIPISTLCNEISGSNHWVGGWLTYLLINRKGDAQWDPASWRAANEQTWFTRAFPLGEPRLAQAEWSDTFHEAAWRSRKCEEVIKSVSFAEDGWEKVWKG